MVKDDVAVVIDVGITRVEDETTEKGYRIVGDVDLKMYLKSFIHYTSTWGVDLYDDCNVVENTLLAREQRLHKYSKAIQTKMAFCFI